MTGYIGIGGTAKKIKNIYIGVGGTAKQVKKAYIGVGGVAKLWYRSQREWVWDVYAVNSGYNLIEGESSSDSGYSAFYAGTSYTLSQSTGEFTVAQTTQIARSSTGATNAVGKYFIDTYSSSGTYTGGTVYLITAASYNWLSGLSLTVTPYTSQYYESKGSSVGSVVDTDISAYPVNTKQNGYWYTLRDDIGCPSITYSGTCDDRVVIMDDSYYRLLTLTSSGTLSASVATSCDVWACGGGSGGGSGGGAGSRAISFNNTSFQNLIIVIGAGGISSNNRRGGATVLSGDVEGTAEAKHSVSPSDTSSGGTGGGRTSRWNCSGRGDGEPKLPFNSSYFPYPFCDGGGGGGEYDQSDSPTRRYAGGAGGTNGGNGSDSTSGGYAGGAGGGHYGGAGSSGGSASVPAAGSATGYGSGGGEAGYYVSSGGSSYHGQDGNGYQGVCFIRVPVTIE